MSSDGDMIRHSPDATVNGPRLMQRSHRSIRTPSKDNGIQTPGTGQYKKNLALIDFSSVQTDPVNINRPQLMAVAHRRTPSTTF